MTGVTSPRRRRALFVAVPLLGASLLLGPGAQAAPFPSAQTQEEKAAAARERQAASALEDSSQVVQAAGAALRTVAAQLPRARADVDRARGELAGARARASAATAAVARAETALTQARAAADLAGDRVDQGRIDVNRLARRAYQRGALSDLRDVMDASSPQDVVVRAGLLRSVFRSRNDTLARLSTDRLALARTRAGMAAQERVLTEARQEADRVASRARTVAVQAEAAVRRVADLVARRSAALRVAEANRAQDQSDYAAAQAASKALGERIREAARKAAAARAAAEAVARRQAAADAARKRAGQRPTGPRAPSRSEPRDGDMLWPAPGRLTSRYGWRTHPIYGDRRFHAGIDIGGGYGARVSAADTGIVTYAGVAGGYGTLVVISHRTVNGKDLSTAYAHMSQLSVVAGQSVGRGDKVGEIGNEGNSTGPHLHFEVRLDGDPVDPLDYVSPP